MLRNLVAGLELLVLLAGRIAEIAQQMLEAPGVLRELLRTGHNPVIVVSRFSLHVV